MEYTESDGSEEGSTVWRSPELCFSKDEFPIEFRLVANGHRSTPNTRPLIWDSVVRVIYTPPQNGVHCCEFEPTPDNSDTGWVTSAGVGAFQLRVGQPPGSAEPLVQLDPGVGGEHPYQVDLYEARPTDPTVPRGKVFARLTCGELGLLDSCLSPTSTSLSHSLTFLMNSQSLEALAFRVDVTVPEEGGRLLARGFVPYQSLAGLEGTVTASLVTPDALQPAGTFRAGFLVVTALSSPQNNLGNLQRMRWMPNGPGTLDIGHRGSGASKVLGHSVRENTLLSFQKAAVNHSDFIEFDVHVTADGEVVVHHDFEVRLALGKEVIKMAIPLLDFNQMQSPDFTHHLVQPSHQPHAEGGAGKLGEERARRNRTLQRNMSSAEDMMRSVFKPRMGGTEDDLAQLSTAQQDAVRWFLADRIATLREAFRRTPPWLGFNIELKYPTYTEVVAMRAVFYSRNIFVDEVLKVVLEEGHGRKVIFSTFDPDCATLLSLKQPRYPVFFLTCGGTKEYADPRMNSLEAAMQFAISSHLQGVVVESRSVLGQLQEVVEEAHRHGLFFFTWGDLNNDMEHYLAQKRAGVDAIIMDDVARMAKATNKQFSLFNKPLRSPASKEELVLMAPAGSAAMAAAAVSIGASDHAGMAGHAGSETPDMERLPSEMAAAAASAASAAVAVPCVQMLAIAPIGSPM